MKLRLRGDTLRLRLTRSEVDAIGRGEPVAEQTQFPNGLALSYRLAQGDSHNAQMDVNSLGAQLNIEIERNAATAWAESDQVGVDGESPLNMAGLAVLIEKDFTCITPREGEEELDTYPNPNAQVG